MCSDNTEWHTHFAYMFEEFISHRRTWNRADIGSVWNKLEA